MGILEDIGNMKAQGIEDKEITKRLQERGASPKAIEDAFNQMRIKQAISAESSGEEGMEPSIMKNESQEQVTPTPQLYIPKTQEIEHEHEDFYSPQPPPQVPQFNNSQQIEGYGNYQEEYAPQEGYADQGMGGVYDTDTVIEVAEQVFSEKIKKYQKQIESLNEFATLVEARISNDHERIKRMEEIIDKLQASILDKIGSYGRNVESIKNEIGMMQESFEKMVPVLHEKTEKKRTTRQKR